MNGKEGRGFRGWLGRLQEKMEMNIAAFTLLVAIVVSIGGIATIVPLLYLKGKTGTPLPRAAFTSTRNSFSGSGANFSMEMAGIMSSRTVTVS